MARLIFLLAKNACIDKVIYLTLNKKWIINNFKTQIRIEDGTEANQSSKVKYSVKRN